MIKLSKTKELENNAFYKQKFHLKEEINKFLTEKSNKIIFNHKYYAKDTTSENEINYIYSSEILRTKNYNILFLDKVKMNVISGKILQSIIKRSSSISGLLSLQLNVICQNMIVEIS